MPTRSFQGASAEERAADRRGRLLEAALDVVGERGVADFTMTAVCRTAGLTERYFYESFARREDLLAALFDTASETALSEARAAAAGVPGTDLETLAQLKPTYQATVTAQIDAQTPVVSGEYLYFGGYSKKNILLKLDASTTFSWSRNVRNGNSWGTLTLGVGDSRNDCGPVGVIVLRVAVDRQMEV